MNVKCFWLEPLHRARLSLRRYASIDAKCPATGWAYHDAQVVLFEVDESFELVSDNGHKVYRHAGPQERADVERLRENRANQIPTWPTHCVCGYAFADDDAWQVFQNHLYRRADTNEVVTLRAAQPGAMWDAAWMPDDWRGPDGRALVVRLPNGNDWHIDGKASNCTMPDDYPSHRCWVRHGEPPNITVDKNGRTCGAGAGSILSNDYHGFLRNGELVA